MIALLLIALLALTYFGLGHLFDRQRFHRPAPKRPLENIPDTSECRTAIHEAGHAVAAWCCTGVTRVTSAEIDDKKGVVKMMFVIDGSQETAWCRTAIMLAGIAAEMLVFPKTKSLESQTDLLAARELASTLTTDPPWSVSVPGTLPFDKLFATPLSDKERLALHNAYTMAKYIVIAHGRKYFRIVSMLLAQKNASEADMERVLGNRNFMSVVGIFKTSFVMPRR